MGISMVPKLLMIYITSLKKDSGEKRPSLSCRTLIMLWISVLFSKGACGAGGVNSESQHRSQGARRLPSCTVFKTMLLIWMAFKSWIHFFQFTTGFILFSRSVMSDSLWPHGLQHTRPPCPSPTPGAYSYSYLLSRWCHPTISSSVVSLSSCLQSFPASLHFFQSVSSQHQMAKVVEFKLQHQSFQWIFRADFL